MYIKAHPFGYIKQHNRSRKIACKNSQCFHIQTIKMNIKDTYIQTKVIYHTIKQKITKGRTFAEMVYNSIIESNNYGAWQRKFAKNN